MKSGSLRNTGEKHCHQIHVHDTDLYKTMFQTCYGLYEFVVLPLSPCNVLMMFMHLVNNIFHDELDHCILIYLDDILIFSPLIKQHLCNMCIILQKLC